MNNWILGLAIVVVLVLWTGCIGINEGTNLQETFTQNNTKNVSYKNQNSYESEELPIITSYFFGKCNETEKELIKVENRKATVVENIKSCTEPRLRMKYHNKTIEITVSTDGNCCNFPVYLTFHNLDEGDYTLKIIVGNKTIIKSFSVGYTSWT